MCLRAQRDQAKRIIASSKDMGIKVEYVENSKNSADGADDDALMELDHDRTSLSVFTSIEAAVRWAIPYSQVRANDASDSAFCLCW